MRLERWTARIQSERSTTEPLYVSFTGQPNLFINHFLSLFPFFLKDFLKPAFTGLDKAKLPKGALKT